MLDAGREFGYDDARIVLCSKSQVAGWLHALASSRIRNPAG